MGRLPSRMVKCLDCGNFFRSSQKNPQCSCGSRNVVEATIADEKKVREPKAKAPEAIFATQFNPETLSKIQMLLTAGVASDTSDLIRKAIDNMVLLKLGGIKMNNPEGKSLKETLEDLDEKRLLETEIKRRELELENLRENLRKQSKPKKEEKEEEDLDKLEKNLDKLLRREMLLAQIEKLKGKSNNPEIEMLRQQIAQLQTDKRYDELLRAIDRQQQETAELKRLFLEREAQKAGTTQTDLITQMTKIFADRDKDLQALRAEVEKARQEALQTQVSSKLEKLEERLLQLGNRSSVSGLAEDIKAVKEIAKEFSGKSEKTGGELAKDLIESTIEKIKEPILAPIGQALAEKARQPFQPVQQIPLEQNPENVVITPSEVKTEEDYSDLVQISKEE
jgi:hypothetical protein